MPRSHHKHAKARPFTRRLVPIVVPAAVLAGIAGVSLWPDDSGESVATDMTTTTPAPERDVPLSRSSRGRSALPTVSPTAATTKPAPKPKPTPTPTPKPTPTATASPTPTPTPEPTVAGYLYVTTGLNVRTGPDESTDVLTVLERGTKVAITGTTTEPWVQILIDDEPYWVSGEYLSETEPAAEEEVEEVEELDDGISSAECESGSEVEEGLTANAIRVHRAVCAQFPDVSSYGGLRSDGEHGEGRALDIMVSSSSLGDAIASWVRDNYDALGVSEVIWAQQIWTVERSEDGWRWMEDRGDPTANHYDHVHVTVYGDEGTS